MNKHCHTPQWSIRYARMLQGIFVVGLFLLFLPWQQFTLGSGRVIALNPNERLQEISAPINGLIKQWHVKDGDKVKKDDLLFELVDIDPFFIERLENEKKAAEQMLSASQSARDTAILNVNRQESLFKQGLSSRKEFEKAKIDLTKLEVDISKAQSNLIKAERDLARQLTQKVKAPRDGIIVRVQSGEGANIVKAGDPLVVFAPLTTELAVELWVEPNDVTLIPQNSQARIQFAGWPAVQIPGWPSLAIGTFKGQVSLVDATSSYMGKFRVLITPEETWPSELFIKQGAGANGFINIGQVPLWWEIWRIFNGIPPVSAPIKDEISKMLEPKKATDKDQKEDKEKDKK